MIIRYEGAEWSTLRFAGNLLQWDVDAPVPPPHKGFNIIRHVGGYPYYNCYIYPSIFIDV